MSLRSFIQDHPAPLVWSWEATAFVLRLVRPVFAKLGMETSSKIVKVPEELIKGALFNCQDCAQCVLHYSGMTCPMNCPKSLRNGPCGGVRANGNCEVKPEMVCVWYNAYHGSERWPWPEEFHELRPHASYNAYWNFDGLLETGRVHLDQHWQFRAGHEFHTGLNLTREGVTVPFEIFPDVFVPAGTYDHQEAQLVAFTNQGAPLSARVRLTFGGFFGGSRVNVAPQFRLRMGDTFNAEATWSRNDIDLPWGAFVTNLVGTRMSYSFNPRVYLQALVQYNDRADLWSSNIRFGWLNQANTGLFVVYNDTQGLADSTLLRADRSLTIKFSRLLDLLN